MVGDPLSLLQGGRDLVEVVNEAKAAVTVYKVGSRIMGELRRYIGNEQEDNLRKTAEIAAKHLEAVPTQRHSGPSPSLATPILEGASQENREKLQKLWACLLANAMVDQAKVVRYEFSGILAQFDPQDAMALEVVRMILRDRALQREDQYVEDAGLSKDDYLYSCQKLESLGLIRNQPTGLRVLLPAGRLFIAATSPPLNPE